MGCPVLVLARGRRNQELKGLTVAVVQTLLFGVCGFSFRSCCFAPFEAADLHKAQVCATRLTYSGSCHVRQSL